MEIQVTTEGAAWSPGYWAGIQDNLSKATDAALRKWINIIWAEARSRAPRETGKMAGSVRRRTYLIGNEFFGNVVVEAPQGAWTEYGTGIYSDFPGAPKQLIYPKNAKALKVGIGRFATKRAATFAGADLVGPRRGQFVTGYIFRKYIRGQEPQHWFLKILEEHEQEIRADLEQALKMSLSRI